ncbi:hypothetical protein M427DRAFT_253219 [Gonapodya prolifera JEL478]|uniref:Uncharacterized protein n=1 Tax=Gonapodya prolifera (strain JEL478) TaxID=1344416 RepID=A0A139AL61_GONPJ|nr:hypothetical protein M427DRAFT_253219 [Gonapodya prolifera JEL478]|eukprot:KXS17526.1 hypothetical protein M427DRAFT_253219 [Gonapodya prolifera JEL478]
MFLNAPPKLLLGHISMLTDICTSVDDRFIITADRDDHVRVTHYPRTHVILNWCLGHTQFISQIQLLPNFPDYLLSAGGDDTLLLWKWPTAQLVQTVQLEGVVSSLATNPSSVSEQSTVSSLRVSANGSCIVLLCEDLRHVVVYTVAVLNGTPHVSFSRTVELRAQPLDATFSNDGNLYKSAPLSHSTIGLDLGTLGWKEKYDLFPTGKWRKEFDYGNEEGEGDRDDSGEEEGADAEEKGKKKKKTKR